MINSSYYGILAEPNQPAGNGAPQPSPETSTTISTMPAAGRRGVFSQAGFWIVAMVALAIGLVHVSIRFS